MHDRLPLLPLPPHAALCRPALRKTPRHDILNKRYQIRGNGTGVPLMSVYGLPARRWEEDRSWFYGGATATTMQGTTTKPLSERHERERMNRVRTGLNCWNVDRSSAVKFGKPIGLEEDEAVKGAKEWYHGGINRASWHGSSFEQVLLNATLKPTPMGALTQLYAGSTVLEVGKVAGGYFILWARLAEQRPRFKNEELQERFKEWVDAELRVFEESDEGENA
ncbi:hypothetical protein M422DRAFT_785750 [Sphaerobolus stellatus SS14]|uniref:Uncharacterized protein n=1 Tax=Sphaerobolus stellatus (strain SS14) TaxID=990650 RepID=A0A0C9T7C6_SPHS4|nr:hypothetical protein M422DRAFT_785750 [Sphaerobolus stellatus SS14]